MESSPRQRLRKSRKRARSSRSRSEQHEDGTVIALEVKNGDRVRFGNGAGTETKLSGEERVVRREEDILGAIES